MLSPRPLAEKTVWITGASRGIGRAIAITLARAGAHVVIGSRNADQLGQVAETIQGHGERATALSLDVSVVESCEAFARAAVDAAGPPDILINNAGVGVFRPVDMFRPDEFERQFRVNVFGTFHMCRLAVPLMKQAGDGHIVNISSLAGESEAHMATGYFASKHAVHGFTGSLLHDLRQFDIKVTLVCPGSTDTRFHHESHPGSHPNKDQSWMISPDHVAQTVLFVLAMPAPALISKVDIRPLRTPAK